MNETGAALAHDRTGLARLWHAYGRGSAMLFESAPRAHLDLRPDGALTLSGEPFVEINYGLIGGSGDAGPAVGGRGGAREAPGDRDTSGDAPSAESATVLLGDFAEAILDRRLDAYVMAGSAATPALRAAATDLGLAVSPGPPLLARPRTPDRVFAIQQETVTVERVEDEWALHDVAGALEAAFAAPPGTIERAYAPPMLAVPGLDVFVLRLQGEAACAVATSRVDDLVGIWMMGTVPALRRRHLGRRLLEAVIDAHGDRPDPPDWFFLTASAMGRPLYESLGFTVVDQVSCVDVHAAGRS